MKQKIEDIENAIRTAKTAEPSEQLDRAMQDLFDGNCEGKPRPLWSAQVPIWQAAAACAVFALGGALLHRSTGGTSTPQKGEGSEQVRVILIDDSLRAPTYPVGVPVATNTPNWIGLPASAAVASARWEPVAEGLPLRPGGS